MTTNPISLINLLAVGLGTWYLCLTMTGDFSGPFGILIRIRLQLQRIGLDCPICLSLWVSGLLWGMSALWGPAILIVYIFAAAGISSAIQLTYSTVSGAVQRLSFLLDVMLQEKMDEISEESDAE